ncbi:MAG: ankyrin repeat domain-containing protein [Chlamydiota bacterium]
MLEKSNQKEADLELKNVSENTPLHEAVRFDNEGRFLNALINAGADINANSHYNTPLESAIQEKNLKAIELLIKAGAEISEYAKKELETRAVFSSLRELS